MKRQITLFFALIFTLFTLVGQKKESYLESYKDMMKRTEWFRNARFGMFIHFGAYAIPARGEWVKTNEKMTNEQYQPYIDAFKPSNYNPKEWAKLAKQAGMKYVVMTAKHHDGFCLFDSQYTDYKITKNMPNRDFIKEYIEAFRSEGLKVGLYYSLIDWHHSDYPNVGNHPMRDSVGFNPNYKWENYIQYMHNQIEELMTKYGKIDILWLDYSFGEYSDTKWKAKELVEMIKSKQPEIILNNRLIVNHGTSKKGRMISGYGDFDTPEQGVPDEGLVDNYGNPIPWETCLTLNNNWGYSSTDFQWKSPELIVQTLVNCVSKNGNLLLNVGPDAQGTIPEQSQKILKEVGEWMKIHHESIYGCGSSQEKKPEWGYLTQKGNVLYAHWTNPTVGAANLKGIAKKVKKVTVLTTGKKAFTREKWWGNYDEDNFFINLSTPIHFTFQLPNKYDTVLKIELKER